MASVRKNFAGGLGRRVVVENALPSFARPGRTRRPSPGAYWLAHPHVSFGTTDSLPGKDRLGPTAGRGVGRGFHRGLPLAAASRLGYRYRGRCREATARRMACAWRALLPDVV